MMRFESAYEFTGPAQAGYWFLFRNNQVLLQNLADGSVRVPVFQGPAALPAIKADTRQFLGTYDAVPCFMAELADAADIPSEMTLFGLRQVHGAMEDELFWIIGRAAHLLHWDENSRYCGHCGAPLQWMAQERGKKCPQCDNPVYPRLSPAIIVAVLKEDRILLARAARFPDDFRSVLAGFVEPGETLEDCVRREVKEEVGIAVKDLQYFGSQPWPFPDSLMIGFIARYAAGEIRVDNQEILTADWFLAATLPRIPERISIARRMIDWFVAQHS